MDVAAIAKRRVCQARASELRTRAASARREAAANRRHAEETCARSATVLVGYDGRPFGDRDGSFLLCVAKARPFVRLVRHDLGRWLERAGLPADLVTEVTLACSEACANAVEHPQRANRQLVEVEATLDDAEFELRIRDFGAWNERTGSPLRGRGLDMIRSLMDSLDVQRTHHGTEIVMHKSLSLERAADNKAPD